MKYEQVWEAVDKLAKLTDCPLPDWQKSRFGRNDL